MEIAVLDAVSRAGGLTPRDEVVAAAFPGLAGGGGGAADPAALRRRRAGAEAAVSRALLTLERKGYVVRERNRVTGRTMVRAAGGHGLPTWELIARAEEDLAVHCTRVARHWQALARRAQRRAAALRGARDEGPTEAERQGDLARVAELEDGGRP